MSKNEIRIAQQLDSVKFYKELARYSKNPTFTTLISILFAILLLIFAIKPSFAKITELKAQIDSLTSLETKLKNKVATLKKIKPQYEKAVQKKDLLYSCLPQDAKAEIFERQIRYYVQKNNLPFKSMSLSAFPIIDTGKIDIETLSDKKSKKTNSKEADSIKELSNFTPISFTLNLEGDYEKVKLFLFDFQKNIRATDLDNVNLSQDKEGNLKLSISGVIYYYQDKLL